MKRRNFLRHAASSLLLPVSIDGLGAKIFPQPSPFMQALLEVADNTDRVLVVIQLNGGNDGLNMVIPLDQMSRYTSASFRGNIAISETKALKLKGKPETGLHPAMTGLQTLYNEGKLSIVQAVSYPNPNFSHFRASDIWMTAVDSSVTADSGWLGRYMETRYPDYPDGYPNASMPDPLAIQIGYISSTSLLGNDGTISVAIPDPDTFSQLVGDKPTVTPGAADNTYAGKNIAFLRQQQLSSVAYAAQIKTAAGKGKNMATYPTGNSLADQLKIVARLIHGGLQTKVYYVTLGGFDTHANQVDLTDTSVGTHATLLKYVSDGIKSFQDDIKAMGVEDKVVGMTFSEFGRRAIANGSRGTDHGWGAPMFVFGSAIKTQMIGKNPDLNDLENNNIKMQTDFRQVYAAILEDWFGASATTETAVLFKSFQAVPVFKQTITGTEPLVAPTFRVYPNPASIEALAESAAFADGLSRFAVNDLSGRSFEIPLSRFSPTQLRLDISELPAGQYILSAETPSSVLRGKLLVVK
jgi:uncharacterized protein (DUF1501 family)